MKSVLLDIYPYSYEFCYELFLTFLKERNIMFLCKIVFVQAISLSDSLQSEGIRNEQADLHSTIPTLANKKYFTVPKTVMR